jgi:hypothetical protein
MLSRRELLSAGVAGSLMDAAGSSGEVQQLDREAQREIADRISSVEGAIRGLNPVSLAQGPVAKIRGYMEQFIRSHQKFPDFMEVGIGVFFDMYDWHVKHAQQLVVTRQGDGRYAMQFMFTFLILRPDQDTSHIGFPYDRA